VAARGTWSEEEGKSMAEPSLYERLGGVFAIAAVIDHFSDAVVQNAIVGQASKNPDLREWHTNQLDRLPGLKFMRTLWVCNVAGGPLSFAATKPGSTPLGLEEAVASSTSPRRSSTRSRLSWDAHSIISGSLSARRMKSWRPLPPTRGK
jgi:hypothetical protein